MVNEGTDVSIFATAIWFGKYGLDAEHIVLAAKKVLEKKQNALISI